MRRYTIPLLLLALIAPARASYDAKTGWIVNEHWLSGVPLGGIGVGKVEIYTDGWFGRATINHNWDRPTKALAGALAVISASDGVKRTQRTLRLPAVAGGYKDRIPNVAKVAFRGTFPSAELAFRDPALPVKVDLHAWSSLIPNNAKDSSLPVAHLDYTVSNLTKRAVSATLMLGWPNYLGYGGRQGIEEWTSLAGNYQTAEDAGIVRGLLFRTKQHYSTQRQNVVGEYFMGVISPNASLLQMPTFDPHAYPVTSVSPARLFVGGSEQSRNTTGIRVAEPCGAVAVTVILKPGEARTIPFIVAWAMPTHRLSHKRVVGYSPAKPSGAGINLMLDSDPATRWSTNRATLPGDAVEITLPEAKALGNLTLDSKASPHDYPHGFKVQIATDGPLTLEKNATAAQAATRVKDGVLSIDLRGSTAKRIRITNTGLDGFYRWSIYQLSLTDLDGNEVPLEPSRVRAFLSQPIFKDDSEQNAGHYWQNSFNNVRQIAAYAADNAGRLWRSTLEWQQHIADSNLPVWFQRQMVNAAFPAFSNTILTKDGRFSVLATPIGMGGALGAMDQRMSAHALWTQFFHEQDMKELDMFARAQDMTPQRDGRITRFVGNVHEVIGNPNAGYGVTGWPDLSASWVLQVLKEYRWTGDKAFLKRNIPHIERAIAFLKAADHDGDGIPEGGSAFDYEQLPAGAFIYTATCTLGALQAAIAAEREVGNSRQAATYEKRFKLVQAATMRYLWTGGHFRKWAAPDGRKVDNTFVASLAGDWLAQLTGLPRTLPRQVVDREISTLLTRHLWAFNPVPPMEVKPDGSIFKDAGYMIEHQAYLGDEAIYQGYADDGMEMQRRMYQVTWEMNNNPWDESLSYNAPDGRKGALVSCVPSPAAWHTLNALTGTTLDIPNRTFYVAPHIPKSMGELHVPVFFPTFWARVDAVPSSKRLTVTILKTFGETPSFTRLMGDVDGKPISLRWPLPVTVGARWDLSRHWDRLVAPARNSLGPGK